MPKYKQFSSYYFIVFVAITAIGLAWYFAYSNINQENKNTNISQAESISNINVFVLNSNLNENINANINTAVGGNEDAGLTDDLGIAVSGYEINRTSSGDVVNLDLGGQNNISVMPVSYLGIVRNSIGIKKEESVAIAGIAGTKLTGASAKDGSTVSFIIVENNGQLYYFKGTESFLNNLNNIIKFN